MARTLRNAKIDTRSARSKLPVAKTIYWVPLTHGHALGYRKGTKGGAWVAKYVMPDKRLEKTLGSADKPHLANATLCTSKIISAQLSGTMRKCGYLCGTARNSAELETMPNESSGVRHKDMARP